MNQLTQCRDWGEKNCSADTNRRRLTIEKKKTAENLKSSLTLLPEHCSTVTACWLSFVLGMPGAHQLKQTQAGNKLPCSSFPVHPVPKSAVKPSVHQEEEITRANAVAETQTPCLKLAHLRPTPLSLSGLPSRLRSAARFRRVITLHRLGRWNCSFSLSLSSFSILPP